MTLSRIASVLLCLSAITLALMIPGGFVETRGFPDYPVGVLIGFNVFLTVLGLGSLGLAVRMFRGGASGVCVALAGGAYMGIYLLDLTHVFPVAAAPMSATLIFLERIGTLLGGATLAVGLSLGVGGEDNPARAGVAPRWLWGVAAMLALGIVIFATWSAM